MRHTRSHTRNRRSHHALKEPTLGACSNCNEFKRPHHMCLHCGYYKGRQVMDLTAERIKRDARIKAKQERIRAEVGATQPQAETEELVQENEKKPQAKKIDEAKAKQSEELKEESKKHSVKDTK